MNVFHFILFSAVLFSCNSLQKQKIRETLCFDNDFHQNVEKVSFKDVNKIKKLNGKFVEVEGVFRYSFEDIALYPSNSSDLTEAIWIDLSMPETVPDSLIQKFNNKRVLIIGKVNLTRKGHLNGYMATLDSAFCIKKRG